MEMMGEVRRSDSIKEELPENLQNNEREAAATAAVSLVAASGRRGAVTLLASVAHVIRDRMRLEKQVSELERKVALLERNNVNSDSRVIYHNGSQRESLPESPSSLRSGSAPPSFSINSPRKLSGNDSEVVQEVCQNCESGGNQFYCPACQQRQTESYDSSPKCVHGRRDTGFVRSRSTDANASRKEGVCGFSSGHAHASTRSLNLNRTPSVSRFMRRKYSTISLRRVHRAGLGSKGSSSSTLSQRSSSGSSNSGSQEWGDDGSRRGSGGSRSIVVTVAEVYTPSPPPQIINTESAAVKLLARKLASVMQEEEDLLEEETLSQNCPGSPHSHLSVPLPPPSNTVEDMYAPHPLSGCECVVCTRLSSDSSSALYTLTTIEGSLLPRGSSVLVRGDLVGTVTYFGHRRHPIPSQATRYHPPVTDAGKEGLEREARGEGEVTAHPLGVTISLWPPDHGEMFVPLSDVICQLDEEEDLDSQEDPPHSHAIPADIPSVVTPSAKIDLPSLATPISPIHQNLSARTDISSANTHNTHPNNVCSTSNQDISQKMNYKHAELPSINLDDTAPRLPDDHNYTIDTYPQSIASTSDQNLDDDTPKLQEEPDWEKDCSGIDKTNTDPLNIPPILLQALESQPHCITLSDDEPTEPNNIVPSFVQSHSIVPLHQASQREDSISANTLSTNQLQVPRDNFNNANNLSTNQMQVPRSNLNHFMYRQDIAPTIKTQEAVINSRNPQSINPSLDQSLDIIPCNIQPDQSVLPIADSCTTEHVDYTVTSGYIQKTMNSCDKVGPSKLSHPHGASRVILPRYQKIVVDDRKEPTAREDRARSSSIPKSFNYTEFGLRRRKADDYRLPSSYPSRHGSIRRIADDPEEISLTDNYLLPSPHQSRHGKNRINTDDPEKEISLLDNYLLPSSHPSRHGSIRRNADDPEKEISLFDTSDSAISLSFSQRPDTRSETEYEISCETGTTSQPVSLTETEGEALNFGDTWDSGCYMQRDRLSSLSSEQLSESDCESSRVRSSWAKSLNETFDSVWEKPRVKKQYSTSHGSSYRLNTSKSIDHLYNYAHPSAEYAYYPKTVAYYPSRIEAEYPDINSSTTARYPYSRTKSMEHPASYQAPPSVNPVDLRIRDYSNSRRLPDGQKMPTAVYHLDKCQPGDSEV